MRFLPSHAATSDLTYGDVFLVPSASDVASRFDVDLTTADGTGTSIPVVVANMTAVAGRRMAETVARRGGLAVIPQDIPTEVVADVVADVKAKHPVVESAVVVSPHDTVHTALTLIGKRSHGAAVVVVDGRPVGVVAEADCVGVDRFTQVGDVMSSNPTIIDLDVVTGAGSGGLEAAFEALHASRRRFSPVVRDGELVGVLTQVGALRSSIYDPALDDQGRLRIAATVGINGDVRAKAAALLEAGVRIYLYPAPFILHAKHFTIDDDVAVIGSSNMDMRSFALNYEVSLMVPDRAVVARLCAVQDSYRALSHELTLAEWLGRSPGAKYVDNVMRLTAALQ